MRKADSKRRELNAQIRIALPPSYHQSDKSYPVLWVLDGSGMFESAVDVVYSSQKQYVPDMIVVSVGTPPEARNDFLRRRAYDFSSTNLERFSDQAPGGSLYQQQFKIFLEQAKANGMAPIDHTGGSPKFLQFIVEDVRNTLKKDYRMANDNTLFGFSAGGSFVAYALLTRPDGFDRYICGSPGLWNMDGGIAFKLEEQYADTHSDMKAKVL